MKFKNKVVIVTGSGRGIGKAIALAFAEEGASVVVNYIKNKKAADKTVSEIKKIGAQSFSIKADISKEEEVKKMMKQTARIYGGIDIIVNNACIVYDVPILVKSIKQWKRTIDVNLIGTFLCIKHTVPFLRKSDVANIINISSTNGINSLNPDSADYDASKAGVISLTKNFSQALAPKIRVNTIAPGWVNTEINKNLDKKYIKEETEKTAMKRFANPEEIAKMALFLSSNDASFITGSVFVVDGGYLG